MQSTILGIQGGVSIMEEIVDFTGWVGFVVILLNSGAFIHKWDVVIVVDEFELFYDHGLEWGFPWGIPFKAAALPGIQDAFPQEIFVVIVL